MFAPRASIPPMKNVGPDARSNLAPATILQSAGPAVQSGRVNANWSGCVFPGKWIEPLAQVLNNLWGPTAVWVVHGSDWSRPRSRPLDRPMSPALRKRQNPHI